MTEDAVKQRIIAFLAYKGIGQGKFEKMVGISNGYISKLKSSPSAVILNKITTAFPEINKTWLLCGEGEMLNEDSSMTNNIIVNTGNDNYNNAGGNQYSNESEKKLIEELRKQLTAKDKEIEFLRNLVTTLTNK